MIRAVCRTNFIDLISMRNPFGTSFMNCTQYTTCFNNYLLSWHCGDHGESYRSMTPKCIIKWFLICSTNTIRFVTISLFVHPDDALMYLQTTAMRARVTFKFLDDRVADSQFILRARHSRGSLISYASSAFTYPPSSPRRALPLLMKSPSSVHIYCKLARNDDFALFGFSLLSRRHFTQFLNARVL